MTSSPLERLDIDRLLAPEARRTPEMAGLWDWIQSEDAKDPDFGKTLPAAELRALQFRLSRKWNQDLPDVAVARRFTIPGLMAAPPVPVELIVPHQARPGALLQAHGGCWAFGNLDSHQRFKRLLAIETGTALLSVDYRLAPEHPFPAALEDMQAAWRWLLDQAKTEAAFNGPLVVTGDSAGANLALALTLREQELRRPAPHAAMLFYGVYGEDLDSPSYQRFATGYGLTRELMQRCFNFYAPDEGPDAARHDSLVSPLHASETALARLPPLFLNAASLDVLLCDTLNLARRLDSVGASYELAMHEGVHHGFMQFSAYLEEARRAIMLAGNFFKRTFPARA
ncbi:MAG: alpha/beta hydrolase [Hyphomicrobiales bacterium]|nr:alpha/beta hydrolase [Hyphomicrobiales bacterium]